MPARCWITPLMPLAYSLEATVLLVWAHLVGVGGPDRVHSGTGSAHGGTQLLDDLQHLGADLIGRHMDVLIWVQKCLPK